MPRLLLTGMSGFLGWNVARLAPSAWEIVGTVRTRPIELASASSERVDLTDTAGLEALFARLSPDAVLHAAARTDPNYCQVHRDEAWRQNVDVCAALAALCAGRGIPLVYTSTDLVFGGGQAPYGEDDEPVPVNVYGASKAAGEQAVRSAYSDACICRMPLMFGPAHAAAGSFVQPMLKAARAGDRLSLFTDEYRTPASARAAVQGLFLALENGRGLTLHLGGAERISRCDFGYRLLEAFALPAEVIRPCLQADVPMAAPRAKDVSLDCLRARRLGFAPWPLAEELKWLKTELTQRGDE